MAEFPTGAVRPVPQEGRRDSRRRADAAAAVRLDAHADDPDQSRLFYGKSFIYPLVAAPFVKLFGTNGFLVLHAVLLALVVLCAYLFLHARMPARDGGAARRRVRARQRRARCTSSGSRRSSSTSRWACSRISAGSTRRSCRRRTCAAHAWLRDRAQRSRRRGAARDRDVLEADQRAAVSADRSLWLLAPEARSRDRHAASFCRDRGLFAVNMAISGEWNYQGGGRTGHLLLGVSVPDAEVGFDVGDGEGARRSADHIIFNRSVF